MSVIRRRPPPASADLPDAGSAVLRGVRGAARVARPRLGTILVELVGRMDRGLSHVVRGEVEAFRERRRDLALFVDAGLLEEGTLLPPWLAGSLWVFPEVHVLLPPHGLPLDVPGPLRLRLRTHLARRSFEEALVAGGSAPCGTSEF